PAAPGWPPSSGCRAWSATSNSGRCCSSSTPRSSRSPRPVPTARRCCNSPASTTTCCAAGRRPEQAMATTVRNAIFQLHWFFGITAGIVLAVVGVTGGILSFEDELLKAVNPGVLAVQARGEPLSPGELVARALEQRPGEEIASLQLSADPADAAVVGFAAKDGGRRGERRHIDPYSGQLLGAPRHQEFFRTTMRLHRWLVADGVGKQIVGASTVILVFFCLSGLYLRWPRRWGSLRAWLALDWRQKGRNFLWHLHSVVGTWVLLTYLVMS